MKSTRNQPLMPLGTEMGLTETTNDRAEQLRNLWTHALNSQQSEQDRRYADQHPLQTVIGQNFLSLH